MSKRKLKRRIAKLDDALQSLATLLQTKVYGELDNFAERLDALEMYIRGEIDQLRKEFVGMT